MPEIRKPGSLKQRLLALALTTVIMVWISAAGFTYFDACEEFGEILDAHLAKSAELLLIQSSHLDEVDPPHPPLMEKYSRRVAFQVWEGGRVLRLRSSNAPSLPLADPEQGYSNKIIDGDHWRVFSTWDALRKNLIQVAELSKDRDELSSDIAVNLLKPLLFSLPILAIMLWLVVSHSLGPLDRLAGELAQRKPDNLTPLDAGTASREVLPLIERLNRLFLRIDESMQKERRFTSDAAHELRTPVAGIRAQAQVARAASSNSERIHALDNAILGCDHATHLIDQLLTLARIDMLSGETIETCQLRTLASEVIASITPTALNRNVRLELMEGGEVSIRGNPVLLRILLRNLIDNATRHTPPGSSVHIDIAEKQGQASLSVIDNGPSIPAAELEKLGERFYRPLGTSASGSGLGLSIVKRIAEIHAASVQFASPETGNGLKVTVFFPLMIS